MGGRSSKASKRPREPSPAAAAAAPPAVATTSPEKRPRADEEGTPRDDAEEEAEDSTKTTDDEFLNNSADDSALLGSSDRVVGDVAGEHRRLYELPDVAPEDVAPDGDDASDSEDDDAAIAAHALELRDRLTSLTNLASTRGGPDAADDADAARWVHYVLSHPALRSDASLCALATSLLRHVALCAKTKDALASTAPRETTRSATLPLADAKDRHSWPPAQSLSPVANAAWRAMRHFGSTDLDGARDHSHVSPRAKEAWKRMGMDGWQTRATSAAKDETLGAFSFTLVPIRPRRRVAVHCPAPSHDRDAALEALSVRVPAGVDEERLYHHWDGPSEFTKIAHGLRGWVGEDENGDAIDEAAAEANADAARPRRLENLLTAQRERDHEYTLYVTGAGGSGSIPGPSDYASGFEVRTIPHDDPRVALRRKHGAFATRRWDAFEIVAPYAAVVSTREEFEDACADASFDVANRRRSYAVTTETEIQTSPGAAPTPLVFCAADARRANPMRCVNDPAVDPTRKDASRWGALRAHAFKEANCQIIESVDRWGWPRLRVMTTRELHVGDEFLMSYGREYWGFEKRTTEATETMRDVADAAEAEALRSAAAKRAAGGWRSKSKSAKAARSPNAIEREDARRVIRKARGEVAWDQE